VSVPLALPTSVDVATVFRLVSATADVTLVLDGAGTIRDVAPGVRSVLGDSWQTLVGRPWRDTVTIESAAKVDRMLAECTTAGPTRAREINQRFGADQTPFRFSAISLPDSTVLAIGRDLSESATLQQQLLSSQQAMEREYARMRQNETRYRVLFQVSSESVLLADATTLRVTEANSAACAALAKPVQALVGRSLIDLVEPSAVVDLRASIKAAVDTGTPATVSLVLKGGQELTSSIASSRQDATTALVIRLNTGGRAASTGDAARRQQMLTAIDALHEGFVVLSLDMHVLSANPMFCELVQVGVESQAVGQSVERWLGRHAVDVSVIRQTLKDHGVIRNFATTIRGDLGVTNEVTVSGVSADGADVPCVGLVIRPTFGRLVAAPAAARSVEQLRDLVGQVPLKELVRESAELVERMCIEAALNLTSNNRASAAQVLGLSRQGLYSKLRRHGLDRPA